MSDLTKRDPRSLNISPSAILSLIDRWEALGGVHSFALLRHGQVAASGWWKPYACDLRHMLFSLSKSFTSAAAHFAAYEGLLDFEASVISFFPEQTARLFAPDEKLANIKVKHLLSMCTGHKPSADFILGYSDCVAAFLSSAPESEAGVGFSYNTGATYMASAIVQTVTGQTVLEYLRPRLLDPLGITDITFDSCEKGINFGGFGLNVRTMDIAKFGQFLLQRGMWEGKQLLPAEYVDAMTAKHINNWGGSKYQRLDEFEDEELPENARKNDWNQGYGRQFWRCVPKNVYRGDGAYGQLCVVMPDQDAVMAVTAGVGDIQAELNAIWALIDEGGFDYKGGEDDSVVERLDAKLASLTLPNAAGCECRAALQKYSGRRYQFSGNNYGFREIEFDFSGEFDALNITYHDGASAVLKVGRREWLYTDLAQTADDDRSARLSAIGAADGETFRVRVAQVLTPFINNLEFTFIGNRVEVPAEGEKKFTGYLV